MSELRVVSLSFTAALFAAMLNLKSNGNLELNSDSKHLNLNFQHRTLPESSIIEYLT